MSIPSGLRLLFAAILLTMLAVTSWAGLSCPLFAIPPDVLRHPWFIATLCDAYFAFIAIGVWVAWKETRPLAAALWFIALLALGNLAVALYFLRELFRIPASGPLAPVFTRRNPGHPGLPAALVALSIGVYLLA